VDQHIPHSSPTHSRDRPEDDRLRWAEPQLERLARTGDHEQAQAGRPYRGPLGRQAAKALTSGFCFSERYFARSGSVALANKEVIWWLAAGSTEQGAPAVPACHSPNGATGESEP
jgi:hypothetical protein